MQEKLCLIVTLNVCLTIMCVFVETYVHVVYVCVCVSVGECVSVSQ